MDKPYWITSDPTQWGSIEAALERERARMARQEVWDGLFHRHEPFRKGQVQEHNWVIEDFLPRQYVMLLAGPPDAGKGCFMTALAKAVCKGEDFAGLKTSGGPVLWVAMEECYAERKQLFNYDEELLSNDLDIWTCYLRHAPIDTDEGIDCLKYWATKTRVNLIVIDPLYASVSGCNLSDGHYARRAMQNIKRLAYEQDCAVVVLHQVNRGKAMRIADSIQLQATASINAIFSRSDHGDGTSTVKLKSTGRGAFANQTRYYLSHDPLTFEPLSKTTEPEPAEEPKETENVTKVLAAIRNGKEIAADIAKEAGLKESTVRYTLAQLEKSKKIHCRLVIGRLRHYCIKEASNNSDGEV